MLTCLFYYSKEKRVKMANKSITYYLNIAKLHQRFSRLRNLNLRAGLSKFLRLIVFRGRKPI